MSRPTILIAMVAVFAVAVGLFVGTRYRAAPATGPGTVAQSQALADFELIDLQGESFKLAAHKGKALVVNFWATWCAPCREEIPGLIAVQQAFADKGVLIVGIAVDSREKVRPFVEQFGIRYPVVMGGGGAIDLMRDLGNQRGALPYTVFVDRTGAIRDRHLGLISQSAVEAKLRGVLGL